MLFMNLVVGVLVVLFLLVVIVLIFNTTDNKRSVKDKVFNLIAGLVLLTVIMTLLYLKFYVWRF